MTRRARVRRRLPAILAVALLVTLGAVPNPAAGQGAHGGTPEPPNFRFDGFDPTPSNPLRVWILGDSVMNDASPAVTAALRATGTVRVVADSSFGGWGLTTQQAWVADSQQIIDDYHPQVVLGTWSWDDTLAGDNPALYRSLLRQALSVWMAPGDGVQLVVLLQFPPVGPNPLLADPLARQRRWMLQTEEQASWDRAAMAMTKAFPGHVVYLPTAQVFAPGGVFLTWAKTPEGPWVRVRQVDNTHLCPYGAAEMGQLVADDLEQVLGIPAPAPGWQDSGWANDLRYGLVPVANVCPDDQPLAGYDGMRLPAASPT
jgi:hypothetical protein